MIIPNLAPFLALSNKPAPKFWLVNVVKAVQNQVIGRKAKPSNLKYPPHPAIAISPKALMFD